MSGISHFFESFISHYGIPALFLSVALETLGAPLPGESAIIIASAAAAAGELNIYAVFATAFLAGVIGGNIAFAIGRRLGRPAIARFGGRFGITDDAMGRAEAIAGKYGPFMVVFARFVVLLRQLNGLVAGTTGMHWLTFTLANMVGAALWTGTWTFLAYRVGLSRNILPFFWHHLSLVAAIAIPLLIAVLAYLRFRSRSYRRGRESQSGNHTP